MMWVTWRQARSEALIVGVLLAVLTVLFFLTGLRMTSVFHASGLSACIASPDSAGACGTEADAFMRRFQTLKSATTWLNFLPLLLGLLLASPAIADLEHGVHRLVWTQSVSRGRWLLAKIGFGAGAIIAITGGLVLLWTWWRRPFDALQGRFDGNGFNFEGTVPIAYALFAFALCLAAGVVFRRIAPAIGVAFAGFLGARFGVENWLRPRYLTPVRVIWDPLQDPPASIARLMRFGSGDWIIAEGNVDAAGNAVSASDPVWRSCLNGAAVTSPGGGTTRVQAGGKEGVSSCLHDHGILNAMVYQPAHRFWLFQGIESAIFLALSLALFGLAAYWVRRRIV